MVDDYCLPFILLNMSDSCVCSDDEPFLGVRVLCERLETVCDDAEGSTDAGRYSRARVCLRLAAPGLEVHCTI